MAERGATIRAIGDGLISKSGAANGAVPPRHRQQKGTLEGSSAQD